MEHAGWHVLYVRSRFERLTACRLGQQQVEHYLPVYRTQQSHQTVELPLFPSYLFCKVDDVTPLLLTPGVLSTLDAQQSQVERDVRDLRRLSKSGLKYGPAPVRQRGTFALVEGGPLDGMSGFVSGGNRLTIPIKSICRSVLVRVEVKCRLV